jgi:general secretion pathway protein G
MKIRNYKNRSERGLTLIEIMVVLIILSLIMGFIGSKLFGAADRAKRDINRLRMQDLKSSISEYQLRYNSLPPTLDALVNGAEGIVGFQRVANPEQLADAWGRPFVFALENGNRSYKITTLGADGMEGGTDANFDDSITGP